MWATGAVDHGLRPAGTVTVGPFLGRGRRALEPLSGSGIRPTVIDDTTSKPQPATWGQTGISVGHEDLSVIGVCVVTTPIPEVLTYFRSPRRSQPVEELQLARIARNRTLCAEQRRREAEASREELGILANQQAGLRRVATLVARGVPATEIFPAVADELATSLGVTNAAVWRESDCTATLVAARDDPFQMAGMPIGSRWSLHGENIAAMVADSGQPARMDSHDEAVGELAALIRQLGLRGGVGAPIVVDSRMWGVGVVGSCPEQPLPPDTEQRVAEFTALVATAIANAEAHAALTASRTRIVTAADDARRRLERDLHDGAQQRLVSLGLQLRSIESRVPSKLSSLKEEIVTAIAELTAASADLQELARGIHPAILSRGGLGPALKMLARRSAIPVTLRLELNGRMPASAEVAAYYVVAEAITNATCHARASGMDIGVGTDGLKLVLTIRDDGAGGADSSKGTGLIGMIDRVEALGGFLEVASPPGGGTRFDIAIPIYSQDLDV